mmetsp:Transcript_1284/g.2877  ORF Transcript_1284/g.2877 Transcript_1284/m.2877 type:complete len:112 (+) Transcript_1284:1016-1351(+)
MLLLTMPCMHLPLKNGHISTSRHPRTCAFPNSHTQPLQNTMLDPHAEFRARTTILKAPYAPKPIFFVSTKANEHPKMGVILEVIRFGQAAHRWISCDIRIGVQQKRPQNFA